MSSPQYITAGQFRQVRHHTKRVLDRIDFLSRFELVPKNQNPRISQQGVESYKALCPAHHDKSPSLSLGIARDGRFLVHCFAGCEARAVLAAVGLSLSDLYPDGEILPVAQAFRPGFENAILDEVGTRTLSDQEKLYAIEAWKRARKAPEWPQE
jgi:hypothetical protein